MDNSFSAVGGTPDLMGSNGNKKRKPNNVKESDDEGEGEGEENDAGREKGWQLRLRKQAENRMESNRIHARESRRRKRKELEDVKKECAALEEENRQLRIQLKVGNEGDALEEAQAEISLGLLEDASKRRASDAVFRGIMQEYQKRHADWGIDRPAAFQFLANNTHRLLRSDLSNLVLTRLLSYLRDENMPTQDREICKELIRHVELTPSQLVELRQIDQAHSSQYQEPKLRKTLIELQTSHRKFHVRMAELIECIKGGRPATPRIAGSFVLWASRNAACMQMLNELWMELYQRTYYDNEVGIMEEDEENSTTNAFYLPANAIPSDGSSEEE